MFRITQDPSSGSDNLYLNEIIYIYTHTHTHTHTHIYIYIYILDSSYQPDRMYTHTTGPEHAAKHRPRT